MKPEDQNNLRKGWDIILDVDSKFIEFSKIAAELIIDALKSDCCLDPAGVGVVVPAFFSAVVFGLAIITSH